MHILVFGAIFLFGCSTQDALPTDNDSRDPVQMLQSCSTPDCKVVWGYLAWKQGVTAGGSVMSQLTSIEQQAIMKKIVSDQPTWLPREFCDLLSERAVQDRCLQLMSRPHLWAVTKKNLSLLHPSKQTIQFPKPNKECESFGCWSVLAEEQIRKQEYNDAGAYCNAESVKTLREECFFRIAEQTSLTETTAMEFCYLSGEYKANCYEHLIEGFASQARVASNLWELTRYTDSQLQEYWKEKDPNFGTVLSSRLWGEVIRTQLQKQSSFDLENYKRVPKEHHIQLMSALAIYVVRAYTEQSLDEYLNRMDQVTSGQTLLPITGAIKSRNFRKKMNPRLQYRYVLGTSVRPIYSTENQKVSSLVEALYSENKLTKDLLQDLSKEGELQLLYDEFKPLAKGRDNAPSIK